MIDLKAEAIRAAVESFKACVGYVADTFTHVDGSVTVVFLDPMPCDTESPREYDGNVATMINENSRTIDVDSDDEGLSEAREHFGYWNRDSDALMRRYLSIFRPDIVAYVDYWQAGDSFGWGYVTREAWQAAMGEDYAGDVTPEEAFGQEVNLYDQWANGEVYAARHFYAGDPIVAYGDHGAYVDSYEVTEEDCYGFLGYDDLADIAGSFTSSPIVS